MSFHMSIGLCKASLLQQCLLQVACLLLDDIVANRVHWPRQAELRINGMVYRPYGRNANTKLGTNARDEPANAAHRCSAGSNRVSLNCVEDRQFCESFVQNELVIVSVSCIYPLSWVCAANIIICMLIIWIMIQ